MVPQRTFRLVLVQTALALLAMPLVTAQLPWPELRSIYPPGAQAGTSVTVTIGGSHLEETSELLFSHPGIRCERTMIPQSEFHPERPDPARYKLVVASDVPPGRYEVHARTRLGLTAPRAFAIGKHPEVLHSNNNAPKDAMPLPLGTTVNGHSDVAAIDHYRLELKSSQRVLIKCHAEPIDSRMDATLVLYDDRGRELARDLDTTGRDALLDFTAPAEGVYTLHVFDFLYRGGEEYPYRLLAGSDPHIDFIYPPAGQPGTTGKFKIYGRNLPGGSKGEGVRLGRHELETIEVDIELVEQSGPQLVDQPVQSALLPGRDYRIEANGLQSNSIRIGFAEAPIVAEVETEQSQGVALPCEVHGHFDQQGDSDRYHFEAPKGMAITITSHAESIDRASDPLLILERLSVDDKGNEKATEIARNDDAGNGSGGRRFPVSSRDSSIRFTSAEGGPHRVTIFNQSGAGGPSAIYRLVIRETAPGFDLVAAPWQSIQKDRIVNRSAPLLRQGSATAVRVLVMRRNGFNGKIVLSADGLPQGVSCPPVTIGDTRDHGTLIFHAADDAAEWNGFIKVVGAAGELIREARVGTISWSVPDWDRDPARARLSSRLPLSVCATEKAPVVVQAEGPDQLEVTMNGTLEIPFKLTKHSALKGDFTVSVEGLPYVKASPQAKIKDKDNGGKLSIAFKKTNEFPIAPGEWQFTLRGQGIIKYRDNPAAADKAEQERKRIEGLEKQFQEEAKTAKAAVDPARKALQEAEKNRNSASPEAKDELAKQVQEIRTRLQDAEQNSKASEEKAKRATTEKNNATNRAKQAQERAKERDVQFATYSHRITVIVKPAPPKEEGK